MSIAVLCAAQPAHPRTPRQGALVAGGLGGQLGVLATASSGGADPT